MERKAVIICPCCMKVRRFGAWIELTYSERLTINTFTVEEIRRICDGCRLEALKKLQLASNA